MLCKTGDGVRSGKYFPVSMIKNIEQQALKAF